jgi:hypothetical protein
MFETFLLCGELGEEGNTPAGAVTHTKNTNVTAGPEASGTNRRKASRRMPAGMPRACRMRLSSDRPHRKKQLARRMHGISWYSQGFSGKIGVVPCSDGPVRATHHRCQFGSGGGRIVIDRWDARVIDGPMAIEDLTGYAPLLTIIARQSGTSVALAPVSLRESAWQRIIGSTSPRWAMSRS